MALTLRDRGLIKLYYQRNENASPTLCEFRPLKQLRTGPMSITNSRKMFQRSETSGTLAQQSGRGRKEVSKQQIKQVATAIVEQEMVNELSTRNAWAPSRHTQIP